MKHWICSLVIFVGYTVSAAANVSFIAPPAAGMKRVPLEHVMKTSHGITGYRFYIAQGDPQGFLVLQEEPLLGSGKVYEVPGHNEEQAWTGIYAVPEKVANEYATEELLAMVLASPEGLPAGVVIYPTTGTFRDLPEDDYRTKLSNRITLRADGQGGLKFTAEETPAPPSQKFSSGISPHAATIVAGLALGLAIFTGGLCFFRRKPKS